MASLADALEWLKGGPPFDEEERAAFAIHQLDGNLGRLRVLVPLLFFAQLLVVAVSISSSRAELTPELLHHRDAMTALHLGSAVGAGILLLILRSGRLQRDLTLLAAVAWLVHSAGRVAVSHLRHPSIEAYAVGVAGVALLLALPVGQQVLVIGLGYLALCVSSAALASDPGHLRHTLVLGGQISALGLAMSLFLAGARRRDFRLTHLVERQKQQLETLNATLEQRVAEQVRALTRRAEEVERLNTQLRTQVKDRSRALAVALRRLADGQMATNDLEGRVIGERFSIGPRIAAGGMGAVYEGVDLTTDEPVAVKVILGSASTPLAMLERFLREAESAARVDHPAVVKMLHVDIADDGTFFQVQEFVRGETLEQAFERHGEFRLEAAVSLIGVLCAALAAAHACGVVHRDIKPANLVLVRDEPGLKVVDFGISKVLPSEDADATRYPDEDSTKTGAMMGTPRFMSPEQRVDASRVTDRADLYAVALVALLVCRGMLLVPGESAPFSAIEGLDEPLATLLNRCLHRDPAQRPSAAEVHQACAAWTGVHHVRSFATFVAWDALRVDSVIEP